jgi:hypothetical protein
MMHPSAEGTSSRMRGSESRNEMRAIFGFIVFAAVLGTHYYFFGWKL